MVVPNSFVMNVRILELRRRFGRYVQSFGHITLFLMSITQSIQTRLVEENKTLAMERSHLSDLMNNVQRMHNDLERSGENDRRRLENQLQMLENQA